VALLKHSPTALLLLCLVPAPPLSAQDRYDGKEPAERLQIRIGAFVIAEFDTTVRFDSKTLPVGTVLDLEDGLDVTSSQTVARLDGSYRFSPKHRIDWTYFSSRRSGDATATQDIEIGDPSDPDGSETIPVGADIQTTWDFDLLQVGYAWSFLNTRRYEWYLGGGLNIRRLDGEISYTADDGSSVQQGSVDAKGTLPLPTVSIGGRWNFNDKWQSQFTYQVFFLKIGDYEGSQQEVLLRFEHNTFKHVGFGAGLNGINLNLSAENDKFFGELDSRILGLLAYVKVYY
jgi:hypothetical protein